MKRILRTITDLQTTVIFLLILTGLNACLPVPIGDPEKSQIDPDLTGVWFDAVEESLWIIQPYDRRTYLITLHEFHVEDCVAPPAKVPTPAESFATDDAPVRKGTESSDAQPGQEAVGENQQFEEGAEEAIASASSYRPDGYSGDTDADQAAAWYRDFIIAVGQDCEGKLSLGGVYKSWLTRLGKRDFITIETMGHFDEKGSFRPEFWMVYRISRLSSGVIQIEFVDPDFWAFEEVDETRRAYERVIRKHANDPDLADSDADTLLIRIPLHDLEYFSSRT